MTSPRDQGLFGRALAAYRAGQLGPAIEDFDAFLAGNPDHLNALQLLGSAHYQQRQWPEAERCFRRALEIRPDLIDLWFNLAKIHANQGRWCEAEACNRQGLAQRADDVPGFDHWGIALRELGRLGEAELAHRRAIALQPDYMPAMSNLGVVRALLGHMEEAAEWFAKAATREPAVAEVHGNLGNVLRDLGRFGQARLAYQKALEIKPTYELAWSALLLTTQYDPDLPRAERYRFHRAWATERRLLAGDPRRPAAGAADVAQSAPENRQAPTPPHEPHLSADAIADKQGALPEPEGNSHLLAKERPPPSENSEGRRLRIGYVSSDLYQHAVAYFLVPILRHHDRSNFEISVFSRTSTSDGMTGLLRNNTEHWFDIQSLDDEQSAALVRERKIDVLVDLNGHSGRSNLGIFARKPAPVQVTYLGYPDTTGLSEIDYRLTDAMVDPPGAADEFSSERLWRMPGSAWCYQPSAAAPAPSTGRAVRESPVVFGCFNNSAKLNPRLLRLWGAILRFVSGSHLKLKAKIFSDPVVRARFAAAFETEQVERSRLELLPWLSDGRQHLAEYLHVDIALDTFPYNGTTTTCEAMWMGTPVLTLAGDDHRSRVGCSLLTTVGLPDWIASTPDEYVAKAVTFAGDFEHLRELKTGLREQMRASPLVDGVQFTRKLEAAFREMCLGARAT